MRPEDLSIKQSTTSLKPVLQICTTNGEFRLEFAFKQSYLLDKNSDILIH